MSLRSQSTIQAADAFRLAYWTFGIVPLAFVTAGSSPARIRWSELQLRLASIPVAAAVEIAPARFGTPSLRRIADTW